MRPQRADQFVEQTRGVSDGVKNSQQDLDAENLRRDATERSRYLGILIRKRSAQVQQHAVLFDPGKDRRIRSSKPGSQFIGA